ncbi:acyl-[acyl-carrier-protein]--UDP-N-acetylglucosamine O-acyltransferase [Geminocystis sp. NIES-3708]|uniref:acyl-ACP--UDP-N-acetylglucosamine O-acyltransferase n=1 Tax=Geminocystis sp. NIES-3708 TaxID=1615909 RepID=UPI0005FC9B11|nr:acyl-ACP--UDP-N-acetylglucosamine O-acyltransferase [Geminocystis sp. NIES-3708]BAQ62570.1 acyl-[acyl-carrier-protein]--UDP-N-acetylglucosamine O-acyltransferase [Geminocystis sp. NIES-3708]
MIHPTAIINPKAELDPSVEIAPNVVIGADVKIGANTIIGANVVIDGSIEIGCNNQIFPGAALGLPPQDLKYKGGKSRVKIGNGNTIREYVTINRATEEGEETIVGNDNLLMAYVHVAHNCVLGDRIVIANSVALAGHVEVESKAVIGGMLGIHQFVKVGKMAMLGGMSRIDRDVPPYMLVEGNPSHVRSLNLVALKRNNFDSEQIAIMKKAYKILYKSGLTISRALKELEPLCENEHIKHLSQFMESSMNNKNRRGLINGNQ